MKLNKLQPSDLQILMGKKYELPDFNREKMIETTAEAPVWIHFGAGNIFRAFHAKIAQELLNQGELKQGIVVAEGFDDEIIEKVYQENDNYSILVTLKSDASVKKTLISSIAESHILDAAYEASYERLKNIFRNESLQMATFTITEKGYNLWDTSGKARPDVQHDFENGPQMPESYMGKIAALLYERYKAGQKKIALVSTDNCSHNGDKLYEAIVSYVKAWCANKKVENDFLTYVNDCSKVSFPWSMIDKITPRPDDAVAEMLQKDGFEDMHLMVTHKNTYTAGFVNAEESGYLVIEDVFPNGRPELEKAGVIFTDRATVDKVEKMKVCTCLNPLHTALAIFGCLLEYKKISDEMKDKYLVSLVKHIGYDEGLPVVVNPGVIDPKDFIDTVIEVRLPNVFMPDTPQRIAMDTSQKLAIRFGETIKKYVQAGKKPGTLKYIPLVFAGWLRYLMAIDDDGNTFELSADPMLKTVQPYVEHIKLKNTVTDEIIHHLLENERIFGVNLYDVGLASKVLYYFNEMVSDKGAVTQLLKHVYEEGE